jgi:hypothetical protein
MLATINLTGLTALAQAHATDQPSARQGTAQQQSSADATVRRLLARERSSIPNAAHPRLLLDEERSSILNLPNRTPAQAAADAAAHQRLLAQERYNSTLTYGNTSAPAPPEPGGQPGWLTLALGVLAAVLALVAGVAVLAARRANRSQRASQTA